MNLEQVKASIMGLPHTDLTPLAIWLNGQEIPRRQRQEAKLEGMTEILAETMTGIITVKEIEAEDDAVTIDDVPEWVNPGTDHQKMYHPNAIVRHAGKLWVSVLQRINEYEPGAAGIGQNIWAEYRPPAPPMKEAVIEDSNEGESPETGDQIVTPEPEDDPVPEAFPELGTDSESPTVADYADDRNYEKGDQVLFSGSVYECVGDHYAAPGWNPLNAHAYWRLVS